MPYTYELGLLTFCLINIPIWTYDRIYFLILTDIYPIYIENLIFSIITLLSLFVIIFTLEKIFLIKIKHIFTIIGTGVFIILSLIGIYYGTTVVSGSLSIVSFPIVMILPFFYGYLTIKGSRTIRKSSLFFMLGFGALLVGGAGRYETIISWMPYAPEIFFRISSPLGMILGNILLIYGFLKVKNYFYIPIESIFIFKMDSGICLFEHYIKRSEGEDSQLITGGLSGIASLIEEITKRKTKLKEIKQEDMNIILDYGQKIGAAMLSHESIGLLKTKLKEFIDKFEVQYKMELDKWDGDISVFNSSIDLVYHEFGYSIIEDLDEYEIKNEIKE
ncbi:MAG TPA: hypothetical protein VMV49_11615 [Candidatus Deferrimicrobium sp.]|nr:hypothetical protein [Candidatus Deferrimicrobium sp.]